MQAVKRTDAASTAIPVVDRAPDGDESSSQLHDRASRPIVLDNIHGPVG